MASAIKNGIRKFLNKFGYNIEYIGMPTGKHPGGPGRMVGKMEYFMEDLRIRGFRCKSIIDVGANTGYWSRVAKSTFPEANIYMIEPQIETIPELEKFCQLNPGSVVFQYGAAAEPGELTFTIWDDLQGSSFLPVENKDLQAKGKQRKIKVVRIDDLIKENNLPIPELMKLDIQGFELEALKGASTTFGKTEVYILEVSLYEFENKMPLFADVIRFMDDRGYVVYDFPGFLRRPHDGALGQCDVCFVKKNGSLRSSNAWD
jgi:FkbM family methyltransferase